MNRNDSTWYFGANFIPSTAINQLEMWQEESFDPAAIDREVAARKAAAMGIGLDRLTQEQAAYLKGGF